MIDCVKLLKELNEERVKYRIAWITNAEYWDKGYSDGIAFAIDKIMEYLAPELKENNK